MQKVCPQVPDQIRFVLDNLVNLLIGFPSQRPGGLLLTLVLATVGIAAGFVVAVIVGSARVSSVAAVRAMARTYIWLLRGVPLILLLLIVHNMFTTGRLGVETSSFVAALITLVLVSGAYQAEVVASGLRAVPPELIDDARVLGASPLRAWQSVRLPHALRTMKPAFLNQAITLFKDTSVVVVLGVADLTTTARIALGSDVENAPFWVATYLTVGALYFVVATLMGRLARAWKAPRTPGSAGLIGSFGAAR